MTGSRVAAPSSRSRTCSRLAPTTTSCSPWSTSTVPVSAAATACTGVTVRISRFLALRATAGSTTVQAPRSFSTGPAALASWRISSSLRGSPWSATCHLKANIASGPNKPVINGSSWPLPGPSSWCSRVARVVRSRPRLRGHSTSTPARRSAATPSSSSDTSSSVSRVISSGTRSSSSRSRTGHAWAAARSAIAAWVRARSPKPWSSGPPVHNRAASHRWRGSSSSWTWSTRRTEPASSSSSSASTRSEMVTRAGRPAAPPTAGRGLTSSASRRRRNASRCFASVGVPRGKASTTAATRSCKADSAASAGHPSYDASAASMRTRACSSGSSADGSQRPSPGSNRPAPTRRSASTPASASSATVGCGRPRAAGPGQHRERLADWQRDRGGAVGELHRGVARRVGGAHRGRARHGDARRADWRAHAADGNRTR